MQRPATSSSEPHLIVYHVRTYLHVTNGHHICQKVAKKQIPSVFPGCVIMSGNGNNYIGQHYLFGQHYYTVLFTSHYSVLYTLLNNLICENELFFLQNQSFFSFFLCHIILFIYSVPYNIHIVSYYNINLFDKISSDGG